MITESQIKKVLDHIKLLTATSKGNPLTIVVRGLPGSGKSFLARKIRDYLDCHWIDLDSHHMRAGIYHFIPILHKNLVGHWLDRICDNHPYFDIVISDVFPKLWDSCERVPDYTIIVTLKISKEESLKNNTHRVPEKDILEMIDQWRNIPGELILNVSQYKEVEND